MNEKIDFTKVEVHPLVWQVLPFLKDKNFSERELAGMVSEVVRESIKQHEIKELSEVLTVRDQFAAQAMAGIVQGFDSSTLMNHSSMYANEIAIVAYNLAGAMLKEKLIRDAADKK